MSIRLLQFFVILGLVAVAVNASRAEGVTAFAAPKTIVVQGQNALALGFEHLASFPYVLPPVTTEKKPDIPEAVRAYGGKRVAISGYLMPLQVENGLAKQAILMRNLMTCCYGVAPNFNEFVIITMKGAGIRPVMDTPVTMVGTLKVGEAYEDNFFVGIYQLDGEQLIESPQQ